MGTKGIVIIGTSLLIIVLIFASYRTPNTIEEVVAEPTINPQIENVLLSELIEAECERVGVSKNIVYAIINSPYPDSEPRYGLMKLHGDLIEKYNVNWSDGCGVVESVKANVVVGIGRLKWSMENNQSVEGALMVYIYTKPQAQEMWKRDIKTTDWVNGILEELK